MIFSAKGTVLFIQVFSVALFWTLNISAACIDGDCVNGHGTFAWPNGDRYVGGWKNGKLDGTGSFIWSDGDRYFGVWKDNVNIAHGDYIFPANAIRYIVDIRNSSDETGCIRGDCENGYGTYSWISGAKYVGFFENGKKNGQGAYCFPDGKRIEGVWDNGQFVGRQESSKLKIGS